MARRMSNRAMLAGFVALGLVIGLALRAHAGAVVVVAVAAFVGLAAWRDQRAINR
jgi:hypothetical protein